MMRWRMAVVVCAACAHAPRSTPPAAPQVCFEPDDVPRFGVGFGERAGSVVPIPKGLEPLPLDAEAPRLRDRNQCAHGLSADERWPNARAWLAFHLHADGRIDRARVVNQVPPELEATALEALGGCEFIPARVAGKPVTTIVIFMIQYMTPD
jgi:hypothetical protein